MWQSRAGRRAWWVIAAGVAVTLAGCTSAGSGAATSSPPSAVVSISPAPVTSAAPAPTSTTPVPSTPKATLTSPAATVDTRPAVTVTSTVTRTRPGLTITVGPPAPTAEPAAVDGECPYLSADVVSFVTGQHHGQTQLVDLHPHPMCIFYRSDGGLMGACG